MLCRKCGVINADTDRYCAQCGAPLEPAEQSFKPTRPIPNHLALAILVTLCCCIPSGIVAIIYAAQVNPRVIEGNYTAALDASKKAAIWCWVSFAVGLVILLPFFVFVVLRTALGLAD
jgi:uncharacterized membrane protein YvbJ